jgi:hypothetical protein
MQERALELDLHKSSSIVFPPKLLDSSNTSFRTDATAAADPCQVRIEHHVKAQEKKEAAKEGRTPRALLFPRVYQESRTRDRIKLKTEQGNRCSSLRLKISQ